MVVSRISRTLLYFSLCCNILCAPRGERVDRCSLGKERACREDGGEGGGKGGQRDAGDTVKAAKLFAQERGLLK